MKLKDCKCSIHAPCDGGYVLFHCNDPENTKLSIEELLKTKDSHLKLAVEFIQLLRSDGRNHVQIDPILLAERCERALEEIRGKE